MTGKPKYLDIGWKTDQDHHPLYRGEPNGASDERLVKIRASDLGTHSAIIAQSGAGKSYLLGRLIEELATVTPGRCLILDPNSDFRRIHEIADDVWSRRGYDEATGRGFLPTEPSRQEFEGKWREVEKSIKTTRTGTDPYQSLKISWPNVPVDMMTSELLNPMQQAELYDCHRIVRSLAKLCSLKAAGAVSLADMLSRAHEVFPMPKASLRKKLIASYKEKAIADQIAANVEDNLRAVASEDVCREVRELINIVSLTPEAVHKEVADFYLSRVSRLTSEGLIGGYVHRRFAQSSQSRIEVVDLPSIEEPPTRLLAVSEILATEWSRARNDWEVALRLDDQKEDPRKPTWVVVDEAHNLIPAGEDANGPTRALREQFRRIAGEGRKLGLFLILVSQRPDKIDPQVLSECENAIIMRINSENVLDQLRTVFSIDTSDAKVKDCVGLESGRGVILGRWAPQGNTEIFYTCARRTVEGGRNLQDNSWATDPA